MTHQEATSEILTALRTAWLAGAPVVTGEATAPPLLYDASPSRPPDGGHWARPTVRHLEGSQDTLAGPGSRSFRRVGTIAVQVYAPLGEGEGRSLAMGLGRVALGAFEGATTPGDVWFRRARVRELGPEDGWYVVLVEADFEYDEVR